MCRAGLSGRRGERPSRCGAREPGAACGHYTDTDNASNAVKSCGGQGGAIQGHARMPAHEEARAVAVVCERPDHDCKLSPPAARRPPFGGWRSLRGVLMATCVHGGECARQPAHSASFDETSMRSLLSRLLTTTWLKASDSSARFCTCFMHRVAESMRHMLRSKPPIK